MKAGGARRKGSGFEREVAEAIIATFASFGITSEDCYKTPLSGGHRFAKKVDPGDLVISPRLRKHWPFAVECKFYAKISMDLLMVSDVTEGVLLSWWTQATASAGKQLPLLVFRQNRQQAYAMFSGAFDSRPDGVFETGNWLSMLITPHIRTKIGGQAVYVVRLKSLLRCYKRLAKDKRIAERAA